MGAPILITGTGRCGTRSAAALLSRQPQTVVTHERYGMNVPWGNKVWRRRLHETCMAVSSTRVTTGDAGFYWSPHAEWFASHGWRVIFLLRDIEEVANSFKRIWEDHAHPLANHDGSEYSRPPWAECYPNTPKRDRDEALHFYILQEHRRAQDLDEMDGVKVVPTYALNREDGRESIVRAAGLTPASGTLAPVHKNDGRTAPSAVPD